MEKVKQFFERPFVRRIAVILLVGLVLYLTRNMITLFLLTFIFIYLINAAQKFIYRNTHRFIPIKRSIIVVILYVAVLALIIAVIYFNAPVVIAQTAEVVGTVSSDLINYTKNPSSDNQFLNMLGVYLKNIDVGKYVAGSSQYLLAFLKDLGGFTVNLVMALVLSLFFMLEKAKILTFFSRFGNSRIGWIYEELKYFGGKFTHSFGKVIQTQIVISLINSVVSLVALFILGFPNLLGLWAMIFVLGLVPVAGVFISLIPLSIIAYGIGGIRTVIYVLVLIAVLHTLESYVLNPKLMSHSTKLPVFVTFLVLIVSENIFGVWGLIVGIPIVMFALDLLDVKTGT